MMKRVVLRGNYIDTMYGKTQRSITGLGKPSSLKEVSSKRAKLLNRMGYTNAYCISID
ncbi:hypothetical protein SAMN05444972_11844 [Marininema halotolerans]|uniref:Uncharacterized protein n=1 Tax=Marininema halotolerans TaxID=1155944 RepID=A0A1I6UN43_9BACL|nr:hypothetical protein SAMN05444972_11844 [Marininema halotolerans]